MRTTIKPSTHEEWLQCRQNGIGSSEIATIVGLNPWESPYQLWLRKTGQVAPKDESFAMKAGHYLEDAVSRFWSDETKRTVIKSSAGDWLYSNDKKPFLLASPDRTYWLGESRANDNKGILECKTTQMAIDPNDLPKHWFCQVQWQLGVAEMTQGSLAWLCAGREFGYKDIAFVPDFYDFLVEEAEKFWVDNIIGKKEPDIRTVDDVLTKFSRSTGRVARADEAVIDAYIELKNLKETVDEEKKRVEELESVIKVAMSDADTIVDDSGVTLATWKSAKDSTKFDDKKFIAENPEIVKPYMYTATGSRRFLLK